MKPYLAALILFLVAFAGLATGLLLRRKGLRGGCHPPSDDACQCKGIGESKSQVCVRERDEEED